MKVISRCTGLTALAIIAMSASMATTSTIANATTPDRSVTEAWSPNHVPLNAPGGFQRYMELIQESGS